MRHLQTLKGGSNVPNRKELLLFEGSKQLPYYLLRMSSDELKASLSRPIKYRGTMLPTVKIRLFVQETIPS